MTHSLIDMFFYFIAKYSQNVTKLETEKAPLMVPRRKKGQKCFFLSIADYTQ